ncbi:type I glutamate--ammonia ligase [Corynebacterium uterequi]|uniref:Glutamine synthetase n=1 Tax=Corynebacterium uterequi TaxID=1072256 RepID=A0A0G3HHV2_9CORY|nr:type I glutamate--ammonia ligase [Corynebacterium uterequi]AKK11513.1 glutamine synthetase, type I [Corynebacterium uterequi]
MAFETIQDIVEFIDKEDIKFVDVRFTDVPGQEHHFSIPASEFTVEAAAEGLAFDGSSIRGFTTIDESDMTLLPDVDSAYVDPFRTAKTLNIQFSVNDPFTHEAFSRDPRNVAKKAEEYLAATGIADSASFGMEAEFYLFDSVSYNTDVHESFYRVDSNEGWWNRGLATNLDGTPNTGFKTRVKGGYFPTAPVDQSVEVRDAMVARLEAAGFVIERFHHEVGTGGQQEINYRFDTLRRAADMLQTFKYIIKNTAAEYGKSATFMPKPLAGDNGSGMHAHMSLWADGKPLFYDESGYGGLSDTARYYIGGLLHHAPAVLAFTNPTLNSYHRLVPGFEAPINLVYSQRNRSAAIRIPITGANPKAKRVEFRAPDPSGNPYLGMAAMLMAGIDGIKNRIEPHAPVDKDLYELPPEEAKSIPQAPTSLEAAIEALRADNEFLLEGDVFTEDLIETYINLKIDTEIMPTRLRPTPLEFEMYYDC